MTQPANKLMMPSQIGAALGVTDQTVRNWCRKGLVHTRDREGTAWIDLEEAKRYKAQYTGHRHGGRREGAGAKGQMGKLSNGQMKAEGGEGGEVLGILPLSPEALEAKRAAEEAARSAGMLSTEAGIAASLAGAMSVEEANRRMQVLKALTLQIELDRQRGELLLRTECEEAWGAVLIALRTKLEALGPRAAPNIAGRLGLSREQQQTLQVMLGDVARNMLGELSNDPLEELVRRK
jgi:predicted transcriptional regulator